MKSWVQHVQTGEVKAASLSFILDSDLFILQVILCDSFISHNYYLISSSVDSRVIIDYY